MGSLAVSGSASKSKRRWRSSLSTDQILVEISVDDCGTTEKHNLMLHRGLLCSRSPYFHKAFNGHFRESEEKTIYLPDVTASTLRLFQHWIYGQVARAEPGRSSKKAKTGQKSMHHDQNEDNESMRATQSGSILRDYSLEMLHGSGIAPSWMDMDEFVFEKKLPFVLHMARLYAFAEVYNTPQLREDVMTILVEVSRLNSSKISQRDCLKASRELYSSLPSSSPICRFLVKRLAVHTSFRGTTRLQLEPLPPVFLIDMLMVLGPMKGDRTKAKDELHNSCKFHDHKSETETVDCKRRQQLDGTFYVSLLRACMSEVYAAEDDDMVVITKDTATTLPKACQTSEHLGNFGDETLIDGGDHNK